MSHRAKTKASAPRPMDEIYSCDDCGDYICASCAGPSEECEECGGEFCPDCFTFGGRHCNECYEKTKGDDE